MSTTISVKYPIIGAKVVRGKDWVYGNQDGGEGKTGVIIENLENGWVTVLWENGSKDGYRIGDHGMYDLYFENYKDALLQDAMERFPSGCSYIDTSGMRYKNIKYDYPYWYDKKMIALKEDEGLVYNNGVWAECTDVPVKEERVEVFPGIYVGDTVVSLRDVGGARKNGDIFRVLPYSEKNDLFYTKTKSSCDNSSWRLATPAELKLYSNGGKNINDILKKPLSPLEICKQMYSVGDVVETTMGSAKFTETITQKILDNLSDIYTKGFISSVHLKGWLYNGDKQEYAKIIKHKSINTNQNGEKSKSNPSSNGSTNTTNVECSTKRENGIKVQRLNFKIPTTVRSGGAGLKSSDCKIRFGSDSSYNQKRLSIS